MGFTTCLWFDTQAEEAATFYVSVFKDGSLGRIARYSDADPQRAGQVLTVEFELNGQKFVGLNGGPQFTFNEAVSFQIHCADQEETNRYWSALLEGGGEESMCGWLKDRYGVSWQVVPDGLVELVTDQDDPAAAARATQAMYRMRKLDLAEIRRAHAG